MGVTDVTRVTIFGGIAQSAPPPASKDNTSTQTFTPLR